MKNGYIAFGLLTLSFFQGCAIARSNGEAAARAESKSTTTAEPVKKGLVEVASHNTVLSESLPRQNLVTCQLSSGSLVVHPDGTEYVFSEDNKLLDARRIPLGNTTGGGWVHSNIDKSRAIELTNVDAISIYSSIERFKISACELSAVWRIVYELSGDASGGGPDYVVDKRSGQIIYKRYNQ